MSDLIRRRDCRDELVFRPFIDTARIGIAFSRGIVSLIGHVESHAARGTAERMASRMGGARGIVQGIEIQPAAAKQTPESKAILVGATAAKVVFEGIVQARHECAVANCAPRQSLSSDETGSFRSQGR